MTSSALFAFFAYLVVFDFVDYWLHRGQHGLRWWWGLHSLHHSQRQMTKWSDNRGHLLDDLLRDGAIVIVAILSALVVGCTGLALNVSESRVADAKLKALAQRVVDGQEQERARLSRDLHDGISQWLVSIKLQIEAGIIRMRGNEEQRAKAFASFERTAEELNGVLGEVRRISHGLRPALLDDLGPAAAFSLVYFLIIQIFCYILYTLVLNLGKGPNR